MAERTWTNWIKMRTNLDRDPKIGAMAEYLAEDPDFCRWLGHPVQRGFSNAFEHVTPSVTRDIVVASLLRFWGVAVEQGARDGDDLVIQNCCEFTVDEIAGVPGLGGALELVDWARFEEIDGGRSATRLPKFLRDNVPAEDRRRQQSRETSKRHREKVRENSVSLSCHQSVTENVTVTRKRDTRSEKRREEKRRDTDLTGALCTDFEEENWNTVASASRIAAVIGSETKADRDFCCRVAALLGDGHLSQDDVEQCLESVRMKRPAKPGAWFRKCLQDRVQKTGRDLERLLRAVRLGGSHEAKTKANTTADQ